MKKIAVFASGNGTNFQNLVDAERMGKLFGTITLLVTDKPNAYVIERAKKMNIEIFTFEPKSYQDKEEYEREIVDILQKKEVHLIVLAGYMRIIGKTLLSSYPNQIINLHPSLLPAFPGKDAIGQAYDYGVRITGVTTHFVDEGMDTGPIIKQKQVLIENNDTKESLTGKIHHVEHDLLLETVNLVAKERIVFLGRKVMINE